jgi:hypothetical protein
MVLRTMVYALARRPPCELSTIQDDRPHSLRAAMVAARAPISEIRVRAVRVEMKSEPDVSERATIAKR